MEIRLNPPVDFCDINKNSKTLRLIMLSGGMDSCASLVKELTETDNQVHCHHITLETREDRYEAETKSVKHIIDYCRKNYRPFAFTSNKFSWTNIGQIVLSPKDSFAINFVAGGIALSLHNAMFLNNQELKKIEFIATLTYDELFPVIYEDYIKMPTYEAFVNAFTNFFYDYPKRKLSIPKIIFPFVKMTKVQVAEIVPDELKPYVVSCRRPQKINDEFVDCGVCHTCRLIHKREV